MAGLLKSVVSDAGQAAHMLGDLSLDPVCLMLMAASADCALRAVAFRAQVRLSAGAWLGRARPAGALRRLDAVEGHCAALRRRLFRSRRAPDAPPAAQYELFTKFEKCLTIPLLVLTSLTGFLSALQSGLGSLAGSAKAVSTVVAITGFLSAMVHTLNQHLAFATRAEKSLNLSKSYQQVVSKIESELNLMKSESASAGGSRPGLASLTEGKGLEGLASGMGGMLGKIPGFGAEAAPSAPASSGAAAGPTTATKAKFLQMIQTEIATLDGSVDDMPAILSTAAEAAVGVAAVSSFMGCFKRHKSTTAPASLVAKPAAALASVMTDLDGGNGGDGLSPSPTPTPSQRSFRPKGSKPRAPGSPRGDGLAEEGARESGAAGGRGGGKQRERLDDVL